MTRLTNTESAVRWTRTLKITATLLIGVAIGAVGVRWLAWPRPDAVKTEEVHANELPSGVVEVPEAAQQNAGLEVTSAAVQRMVNTLDVTGIVTADESRVSHIRPLAKGVIEKLDISLGSRVTSGQALATYDNVELGQLVGDFLMEQSGLRQAQTDREVKKSSLDRSESLIKIEAIAQRELDVRRAEFRNAEASVASAEARVSRVEEQLHRFGLSDQDLKSLRANESEAPHRAASHSVLRAPFAGVVTKLDVASGEVVSSDKELFTIADLSTVWVLADVYEKDLARVASNGTVSVKVDAYLDRTFVGRVTHVSDIIDPSTRSAKVRCVVDNRDGALKLDMFAKTSLGTTDVGDSLSVPADAVQQIGPQSVVFVRRSATQFERRDVQLGGRSDSRVAILSGLKAGEPVVTRGSFYVKTALLRERIGGE